MPKAEQRGKGEMSGNRKMWKKQFESRPCFPCHEDKQEAPP